MGDCLIVPGLFTKGESLHSKAGTVKVEGRTLTRMRLTRGCYVPVLTRLIRHPSKADLPSGLMAKTSIYGKGARRVSRACNKP